MTTTCNIKDLRDQFSKHGINGYIVPRADEWQGEYVAPYAERLKALTGFGGSYGYAAILNNQAALFVDGRYTVQAKQQVDDCLYDILEIPQNRLSVWLCEQLPQGGKIGFDPWLFTADWVETMEKTLLSHNIFLVPIESNLVDDILATPASHELSPVMIHPAQFSGLSVQDKIEIVCKTLVEKKQDYTFINDPASIAWLLNIRAQDVPHTPYVLSRALISREGGVKLFIHPSRIDIAIQSFWGKNVSVVHPDKLADTLHMISDRHITMGLDKTTCPQALLTMLSDAHISPVFDKDPCALPKACKNPIEIKGIKLAHTNDAIGLVRFFYWLENVGLEQKLNEYDLGQKLSEMRGDNPDCTDDSFDAIVGFNANGAIVHYRAEKETAATVSGDGLLLIDSGGQYPYGTTDITRTIAVGKPTEEMKQRYTDVLKGHIALASARFPKGTVGKQLDILARQFLWQNGLDYAHGTGHGVGMYLSVHEGPQSISPRGGNDTALDVGMVLSNEPGYYKENEYGIRFENLVLVVADNQKDDEREMMKFETISLFPVDLNLVNVSLLTPWEIDWINTYHATIRETLLPLLDKEHARWLKDKAAPINIKKSSWF